MDKNLSRHFKKEYIQMANKEMKRQFIRAMPIKTTMKQPVKSPAKGSDFLCNDKEYSEENDSTKWGFEKIRIINVKVVNEDDPKQDQVVSERLWSLMKKKRGGA